MDKKTASSSSKTTDVEPKQVAVKVMLSEGEYELLQMAASGRRITARQLARTIILENVENELRKTQAKISRHLKGSK